MPPFRRYVLFSAGFLVAFSALSLAQSSYKDDEVQAKLQGLPWDSPMDSGMVLEKYYAIKNSSYFDVSPDFRSTLWVLRTKALDAYLHARREYLDWAEATIGVGLMGMDLAIDPLVPQIPEGFMSTPALSQELIYSADPAFRMKLNTMNAEARCVQETVDGLNALVGTTSLTPLQSRKYSADELAQMKEATAKLLPVIQQRHFPRGDSACETAAGIVAGKVKDRLDALAAIAKAGGDATEFITKREGEIAEKRSKLTSLLPHKPLWLVPPTPTPMPTLPPPPEGAPATAVPTQAPPPPQEAPTAAPAPGEAEVGATVYIQQEGTYLKNLFDESSALDIGKPLKKGKSLLVQDIKNHFYYVLPLHGETGWIQTKKVSLTPVQGPGALEDAALRAMEGKPVEFVAMASADLHTKPADAAQVVETADYGDHVSVLDTKTPWNDVIPPTYIGGWTPGKALVKEPLKDVDGLMKVYSSMDNVPVLATSNFGGTPVTTIPFAAPVYVKDQKDDWAKVYTLDKKSGWVLASFLCDDRPTAEDQISPIFGDCPGVSASEVADFKAHKEMVTSLLLEGFRHYTKIKYRYVDPTKSYDVGRKTFQDTKVELVNEGGHKIFRLTIPVYKRDLSSRYAELPTPWKLQLLYEFGFGQWNAGIATSFLSAKEWNWVGKAYLNDTVQLVYESGGGAKAVFTTHNFKPQGANWDVTITGGDPFSFDFVMVDKVTMTDSTLSAIDVLISSAR